jgi:acyl transferase domain-containing protein/acyl carrier protein
VFISSTGLDYKHLGNKADPMLLMGNLGSAIAGRIARFFNLRGSALMIDTACSSSLVAVHYAVQELLSGDADYALACGMKLHIFPPFQDQVDAMGIVSDDGKTKSYSAEATGTGSGELVGCVLLKPLHHALRDKDVIHAVIKGSAVNQDGALSASLTAPDSVAQAQVIKKAWRKAGIDPRSVGYIEGHGTGTALGDPIEVKGINLAFGEFTGEKHFCALSSVKSNFGHTDSAAGMAGFIKAALACKNKVLFPSLHFANPNPFIDFGSSAVYVNTRLRPWEPQPGQALRRAGVSSFGISGTNCHVVLEEPPPAAAGAQGEQPYLIAVSAGSPESLAGNTDNLRQFLRDNPGTDLKDVALTLGAGRKHHPYRYAFIAPDPHLLGAQLAGAAAGNQAQGTGPWRLLLVFAHSAAGSEALLATFRQRYPAFAERYAECERLAPNPVPEAFASFAFQYGFYHLLADCGVEGKYMVGDGIGKTVIAVIKGNMGLGEAIRRLPLAVPTPGSLSERLGQLLEGEAKKGYTVFAEMAPAGNVATELAKMIPGRETFSLIRLADGPGDPLLAYLREMYLHHLPLDWSRLPGLAGAKRIEMPGYAFKRTRCWLKEPGMVQSLPVEDCFYGMDWVRRDLTGGNLLPAGKCFLLVMDERGLGDRLEQVLREQGHACVKVYLGEEFSQSDAACFTLDGGREADYGRLRDQLAGQSIHAILHLAGYAAPDGATPGEVERSLAKSVYSWLYLVKAFGAYLSGKEAFLLSVTANAHQVTPADVRLSPSQAAQAAFFRGLIVEYPKLQVKCVDVDANESMDVLPGVLGQELETDGTVRFVGYRNGVRYVPRINKVQPAGSGTSDAVRIRDNGVYLVTGGARGIGAALSKSLARKAKGVHLILLGRTPLPAGAEGAGIADGDLAARVDELRSITGAGASVEYHAVDLGDVAAMQALFGDIKARFPKLDGVIHAAGVPSRVVPTEKKDVAQFRATLVPKVRGTLLLDELTRELEPDFFVSFSSLSAVVPHKYSIDYAVANAFLDAFSVANHSARKRYLSINWPGWKEVGMSARGREKNPSAAGAGVPPIRTYTGLTAFYAALEGHHAQLIFGDIDLSDFTVNPFFVVGQQEESPALPETPVAAAPPVALTTEDRVRAIWSAVLDAPQLGLDEDFFEIGGHSLNGSQVLNKIEKEFEVELSIDDLFEYATIRQLSGYVDKLRQAGVVKKYEAIRPLGRQAHYPASHAQQGLYLLYKFREVKVAFNMGGVYEYNHLDADAFGLAVQTMMRRHEVYRTTFAVIDGEVRQRIRAYDEQAPGLRRVDLTREAHPMEKLNQEVAAQGRHAFDMDNGPLISLTLFELPAGKYFFAIFVDHILSDGRSMEVFMKELLDVYNAYKAGLPDPLPPALIQYKEYAAWQEELLAGEAAGQEAFWQQYLGGFTNYNLLGEFKYHPGTQSGPGTYRAQLAGEITRTFGPAVPPGTESLYGRVASVHSAKTTSGASYRAVIDQELKNQLAAFTAAENVGLFSALLASVNVVCGRLTGRDDIVVGTPVSLRQHQDFDDVIGWFLNTVLVRSQVEGDSSFREQVLRSTRNVTAVLENRALPFERILQRLDVPLEKIGSVFINLINFDIIRKRVIANFASCHRDTGTPTFDLNLTFYECSNGIELVCDYKRGQFLPAVIESLVEEYIATLRYLVAHADAPLHALPLTAVEARPA